MRLFKKVYHVLTHRQKQVIWILFVMMAFGAALETLGTSLILPLITAATSPDAVLGNKYMAYVYNLFNLDSVNEFLILVIITEIIVYVVRGVYLFFMYYCQYRFVYNGQYNTSRTLFKEYVHRPYEFFLNASSPVVMRNIVSDVNGTYNLVLTYLSLSTEIIVFIFLLILCIAVNVVMTAMMVGFFILVLTFNRKFLNPVLRRYGHEVQQRNSDVTKSLMQAMNGIKETKVLNKEHYFINEYEVASGRLNYIQRMQSTLANLPRLTIETVMFVGILSVLAFTIAHDNGFGKGSTIGQLATLLMVAIRIMPSANRITQALNQVAYYEPAFLDVEENVIHAHKIGVDKMYEDESRAEAIPFHNSVKLEGVTYRYPGTDVDILENANLDIPIGKSIGLMGPSGAGKSTTVDILLGLLQPQNGKITVDGVDISENLPGWYKEIGYVPQMMFMLDDTIRRNVAYGVPDAEIDDEKVWKALKQAQIDDYVREQPQGLDSSIGERGVRISGGQRQRIGIARALYNDPAIMIFDEATSALDNDTEKAIMEAIERLHGEKTLIIVAHRLTTIKNCDAVYRVADKGFTLQEHFDPNDPKYVKDDRETDVRVYHKKEKNDEA